MLRETYKGRELKILKCRSSKPDHVRQFVGGRIVDHAWWGTEEQAMENLKLIIDRLDEHGPSCPADEYPHWWPPATNNGAAR
ncbi:hypothetical protein AB0C88_37645 [Streptomyces chartreusis]|uniref:hypothetical protein n=1 Tax=Streptomyces chartreusis TaxID=1969 RepID=UPI0033F7FD00